ncbi:hypothetical protein [Acidovorax sp.]|uniref:hypothetical protein n=1 Tax=Acidovorax sp. TaxID=1872122 RepID=UPI002ACDFD4E|nr:hypothetical protein [Acidovorax sp.]MDZ7863669.1 hypothetical protein [Acidovorax sp.]
MLHPSPSLVSLHRVALGAAAQGSPDEIVVLPLRLSSADVPAVRRALHRILGPRLACYRIGMDAAHHGICAHIHLRRSELATCMGLLMAGMPQAEFGRIARLTGAGTSTGTPCVH